MSMEQVQKHRRKRLDAASEKAGGKAALGRLLGYKDGAFVGQMLRGERPVTEETVLKLEAKPGFRGWFSLSQQAQAVGLDVSGQHVVSENDWAILQDLKLVLPEDELRRLRKEADRLRRIAAEQSSGVAPSAQRRARVVASKSTAKRRLSTGVKVTAKHS